MIDRIFTHAVTLIPELTALVVALTGLVIAYRRNKRR